MANTSYDLVVIGGTAGGLSVAISGRRAGIGLIRIVEESHSVSFPGLVGDNELDIGYGESVESIGLEGDLVVISTNKQRYEARACLVATRGQLEGWTPPIAVPRSDRVHIDDISAVSEGDDVLIVGNTDHAVELTVLSAGVGARVVLAAGGLDPTLLSPAGDKTLRTLEHDRRATVLYRSMPDAIGEVDGYPMAFFDDRRTPDLQVDHVVIASPRANHGPADVGLSDDALASGRVWFLGEPTGDDRAPTAPGWRIWRELAAAHFPEVELTARPALAVRGRHVGVIEELRDEHYNATITHFEPTHSDLWVLRVRPDDGDTSYLPGQYATLGLGHWEERIDDAEDPDLDTKWDKLIRRSYSISSRMFDDAGYLCDENAQDELEFYIVLVRPDEQNVPALTPRLARKRPGDRIYLGAKVAGRYTLGAVRDPDDTILFLSTGTGEAPHNAMVIELLRKGHVGPIVSAVSVRQWVDLGYIDRHRTLESRYRNYHYLPLPTREPDVPKRYIQDLVRTDAFSTDLGISLDPDHTHVFLCGNPSMIGLPEVHDGVERFPEVEGVVQLLTERGFTLDRRNAPGNIHYEEYW